MQVPGVSVIVQCARSNRRIADIRVIVLAAYDCRNTIAEAMSPTSPSCEDGAPGRGASIHLSLPIQYNVDRRVARRPETHLARADGSARCSVELSLPGADELDPAVTSRPDGFCPPTQASHPVLHRRSALRGTTAQYHWYVRTHWRVWSTGRKAHARHYHTHERGEGNSKRGEPRLWHHARREPRMVGIASTLARQSLGRLRGPVDRPLAERPPAERRNSRYNSPAVPAYS